MHVKHSYIYAKANAAAALLAAQVMRVREHFTRWFNGNL